MKNIFRYFLLLGVVIIPLFFLYKSEEKFPILLGAFLGVTLTFWIAVLIMRRSKKSEVRSKNTERHCGLDPQSL